MVPVLLISPTLGPGAGRLAQNIEAQMTETTANKPNVSQNLLLFIIIPLGFYSILPSLRYDREMKITAIGFDYFGVMTAGSPDNATPSQQMLGLVAKLRASGYKVGLLSNVDGEWARWLRQMGVCDQFDAALLSGEMGIAKPDLAAFVRLQKALVAGEGEMIFIDDLEHLIEHIDEVGIVPVVFEGYEELIKQLREFEIEV